jgi:hypothetical protein
MMWILAHPSSSSKDPLQSKDLETEREGRRWSPAASMGQCSENPVQHFIKALCNIFREKAKNQIAIFLQQNILVPVAAVRTLAIPSESAVNHR